VDCIDAPQNIDQLRVVSTVIIHQGLWHYDSYVLLNLAWNTLKVIQFWLYMTHVKYTDRFFGLWYSSCDRSYTLQLRQRDPFQATNNDFLINLICVYLTVSGLLQYVCVLW